MRLLVGLIFCAMSARAIELQIYFTAIQRILASQVFTQDGKLYVRGNAQNKCDFAFLEHPVISAAGPKLSIQARFSGRTARNFFGRCVGMGDSFDVQIAVIPYYKDSAIFLREVKVESPGRDGFYIRKVRAAIADSMTKQFSYKVAADAKRILEQQRDPLYTQELRQFTVQSIRIAPDAIVVGLDFQLAVH